MKLKALFDDDDAVSPVIGVILMVAITVILAAVIAGTVMNMSGNVNEKTPQATLETDYNNVDENPNAIDAGYVEISHKSGDAIQTENVKIQGSGFNNSKNKHGTNGYHDIKEKAAGESFDLHHRTDGETWNATTASGDGTTIVAGDSVNVAVDADYEIQVIYQKNSGNSATLLEDTGPAA